MFSTYRTHEKIAQWYPCPLHYITTFSQCQGFSELFSIKTISIFGKKDIIRKKRRLFAQKSVLARAYAYIRSSGVKPRGRRLWKSRFFAALRGHFQPRATAFSVIGQTQVFNTQNQAKILRRQRSLQSRNSTRPSPFPHRLKVKSRHQRHPRTNASFLNNSLKI